MGIVPLYELMDTLGWTGQLKAVILPFLSTASGLHDDQYATQAVPDELSRAARVDGASTMRIYVNVILPALRPGMAVLALLVFMQTWNEFMWPLIVLKPDNPVVQTSIAALNQAHGTDYVMLFTGTAASVLPCHRFSWRSAARSSAASWKVRSKRDTQETQIQTPESGVPNGLRLGAATSAYQIEGAVPKTAAVSPSGHLSSGSPDGGNASTPRWPFDHLPPLPRRRSLMADLGLGAYRFSVPAPDPPDGSGAVNAKGLDFYSRLVDECSAGASILGDALPLGPAQALEDAGAGLHAKRRSASADYAAVVHDALATGSPTGARYNEPWCSAFLGTPPASTAPGADAIRRRPYNAPTTVLLAHAWPRRPCGPAAAPKIGGCVNLYAITAATGSEADQGRRTPYRRPAEPLLPGRPAEGQPIRPTCWRILARWASSSRRGT